MTPGVPDQQQGPTMASGASPEQLSNDSDSTTRRDNPAELLRALYPEDVDGWIVICGAEPGTKPRGVGQVRVSEIDTLGVITDEVASRMNLWYSICAMRGKVDLPRRGREKDVRWVPGLWADVDTDKTGFTGDFVELLKGAEVPPTAIVDSGNGYHIYWAFDRPVDLDAASAAASQAKELNDRLRHWLNGMFDAASAAANVDEHTFGALLNGQPTKFDNVSNLDRIFRLPGSYNFKKTSSPQPVRLTHASLS